MYAEVENEINNRFLDLRQSFKDDLPEGDIDLYLRIFMQETLLNFFAVSYHLQVNDSYKETICSQYLYAHNQKELLKEQLREQLKNKPGGGRA